MTLHIAIPSMDEMDYLPHTLDAIGNQQTHYSFQVYVCVNQPEAWWEDEEKRRICLNNRKLLSFLKAYDRFTIHILDFSSQGKGWKGKDHGVGWARKTLFDFILKKAAPEDTIISLDSDTLFHENYFQSIGDNFSKNKTICALSVPYYHCLTEDDRANRAILRYEIYMRNYAVNMFHIRSPYTFTAIGSAIAVRVNDLRKIGGITPMKSGEDFYLLQKLRKMGIVSNWNEELVYPASRFSSRVFFGTGPAMIKGDRGDWESYPVYHHTLFEEVKRTYSVLDQLFVKDVSTPFLDFLEQQFSTSGLWQPLRKNFREFFRFERAFHEKADALRILQYLKSEQKIRGFSDEKGLTDNIRYYFKDAVPGFVRNDLRFEELSTEELNTIRDLFFEYEMLLRKQFA